MEVILISSTVSVHIFDGIPVIVPNRVSLKHTNFYVSYNNRDTAIYGCDTTALVDNDMTRFLILEGNHEKQYEEIINGGGTYEDCMRYFKANMDKVSRFSDKLNETLRIVDGKFVTVKHEDLV